MFCHFCSIQMLAQLLFKEIERKSNTRSFCQVAASWQKGFEVITNGKASTPSPWKWTMYVQYLQCHLQDKVIFINPLLHIPSDQNYGKPLDCIKMSYCLMKPDTEELIWTLHRTVQKLWLMRQAQIRFLHSHCWRPHHFLLHYISRYS